jgi:hypothetical protein
MKTLCDDETLAELREHPPHLAKLACGHLVRFVCLPLKGWGEWCPQCKDFCWVMDGV